MSPRVSPAEKIRSDLAATKPKRVIFFPENTEPIIDCGRLAGHFSTGGGEAGRCSGGRDGGETGMGLQSL